MKSALDNLRIRRMTATDLVGVIQIAESLADAPHWPKSAYIAALKPESMPSRVALVASEVGSDAVLGFTVASLVPPQAELETIAVGAQSQRQGLGYRLFSRMARELRMACVRELLLEVRESNQAARGFYRSVGFKETGRRPRYYADPIEDAIRMLFSLG
jgi:[ribosomal protein S18]-alanine N-acetyltransferase